MRGVSPSIGLVGRALAATGALLWILSMFLTFYSRGSQTANFWELQRYTDVVTFSLALVVLLVVTASLYLVAGDALMSVVAVIAGYLLALDVSGVIEARNLDIGAGGYVGILGAAALTVGAVLAIAPTLAASAARGVPDAVVRDGAPGVPDAVIAAAARGVPDAVFADAARDTREVTVTDAQPAPETTGPSAGWYADPSGEARLRYWDGARWSESTRN